MPLSYGMPAAGPRCSLGLACTHTPACPRTAPPPSDYYQSKLALEWREWMTRRFTAEYFYDRTFYQVQVRGGVVWCGVVWCGVVWCGGACGGWVGWRGRVKRGSCLPCFRKVQRKGRNSWRRHERGTHRRPQPSLLPHPHTTVCRRALSWTTLTSESPWMCGEQREPPAPAALSSHGFRLRCHFLCPLRQPAAPSPRLPSPAAACCRTCTTAATLRIQPSPFLWSCSTPASTWSASQVRWGCAQLTNALPGWWPPQVLCSESSQRNGLPCPACIASSHPPARHPPLLYPMSCRSVLPLYCTVPPQASCTASTLPSLAPWPSMPWAAPPSPSTSVARWWALTSSRRRRKQTSGGWVWWRVWPRRPLLGGLAGSRAGGRGLADGESVGAWRGAMDGGHAGRQALLGCGWRLFQCIAPPSPSHTPSRTHMPPGPMRRYGLVRVRENAESIAFYGGEDNEQRLLNSRLKAAIGNFLGERAGGPHGTSVWAVRDTDYGGGRPRTPEPVAGLLS